MSVESSERKDQVTKVDFIKTETWFPHLQQLETIVFMSVLPSKVINYSRMESWHENLLLAVCCLQEFCMYSVRSQSIQFGNIYLYNYIDY